MSRPVSLDTFIWDYDLYDLSDLTQRGITALTQVSENALRQWRRDKYTLKANPRSLAHLDRHLRDHLNVETVVNDPESKYDVWGSNGRYITETIDHEPDVAQDMDHTINTICKRTIHNFGLPEDQGRFALSSRPAAGGSSSGQLDQRWRYLIELPDLLADGVGGEAKVNGVTLHGRLFACIYAMACPVVEGEPSLALRRIHKHGSYPSVRLERADDAIGDDEMVRRAEILLKQVINNFEHNGSLIDQVVYDRQTYMHYRRDLQDHGLIWVSPPISNTDGIVHHDEYGYPPNIARNHPGVADRTRTLTLKPFGLFLSLIVGRKTWYAKVRQAMEERVKAEAAGRAQKVIGQDRHPSDSSNESTVLETPETVLLETRLGVRAMHISIHTPVATSPGETFTRAIEGNPYGPSPAQRVQSGSLYGPYVPMSAMDQVPELYRVTSGDGAVGDGDGGGVDDTDHDEISPQESYFQQDGSPRLDHHARNGVNDDNGGVEIDTDISTKEIVPKVTYVGDRLFSPRSSDELSIVLSEHLASGHLFDVYAIHPTLAAPAVHPATHIDTAHPRIQSTPHDPENLLLNRLVVKLCSPPTFSRGHREDPTPSEARRAIMQEHRILSSRLAHLAGTDLPAYFGMYGGLMPLTHTIFGGDREMWMLVMERVGRAVTMEEAKGRFRSRILSAYSRIHAAGVIHNDVSLRHIRLAATASEPERIVIIDFDVSTYQGPPSRSDGRGTRKDTAFEHCRDDREEDQEDDRIGNHPYTLLGERRRSEDEDGYPTHFENAFRREMRDVLKLTG